MGREILKDWTYKKHAVLCTGIYLGLYAFDMTVSYFILRKVFRKMDEQGKLD